MVAIQGFRVELTLKHGGSLTGIVDQVKEKVLTLSKVEFPGGGKADAHSVAGADIMDIKVTDLPSGQRQKNSKKKERSKKTSNAAVVYTADSNAPATPGNATPQPHQPKSAKQKSAQLKRNTGNSYYDDSTPSWGQEDVSGIKSAADFDFSGSTARFDKGSALEEFAIRDDIDDSMRLVGLNKKKTKYSHDENVLSAKSDAWEASDFGSVASTTQSGADVAHKKLTAVLREAAPTVRRSQSLERSAGAYQLVSSSGDTLPLATPVQLLEVERLAFENFKLTPQILAENCSRGIASLVVKMLGGSSRLAKNNHNLPPLVLLLVGNNRAGARALAAGRQLANHGVRTIAFTLNDFTKIDEFDDHVAHQLELFSLVGGRCVSEMKQLTSVLGSIETPVELIVDALQGYDTSIGDLWGSELKKAGDLIQWVNVTSGVNAVLSLDMPAGIDAGSGLISTEDGVSLEAKFVVSTGLPLNGLQLAYTNGLVANGEWGHYLVDIGLPQKLFGKGNLRKFDRSWFNGEFVVPLEVAKRE